MVLTKVVKVFPAISRIGAHILRKVEKIKENDERGDLKTMAARYLAMLQREKPRWKADNHFNPYLPPDPKEKEKEERERKAKEEAASKGGGGSKRGRGGDGKGGKDASLNADAQEFTPGKDNAKKEEEEGREKRPERSRRILENVRRFQQEGGRREQGKRRRRRRRPGRRQGPEHA